VCHDMDRALITLRVESLSIEQYVSKPSDCQNRNAREFVSNTSTTTDEMSTKYLFATMVNTCRPIPRLHVHSQ
jgi:hypothetical protein